MIKTEVAINLAVILLFPFSSHYHYTQCSCCVRSGLKSRDDGEVKRIYLTRSFRRHSSYLKQSNSRCDFRHQLELVGFPEVEGGGCLSAEYESMVAVGGDKIKVVEEQEAKEEENESELQRDGTGKCSCSRGGSVDYVQCC